MLLGSKTEKGHNMHINGMRNASSQYFRLCPLAFVVVSCSNGFLRQKAQVNAKGYHLHAAREKL